MQKIKWSNVIFSVESSRMKIKKWQKKEDKKVTNDKKKFIKAQRTIATEKNVTLFTYFVYQISSPINNQWCWIWEWYNQSLSKKLKQK